MTTMAMFPGQGSQYVGMGKDLLDLFPKVSEHFQFAEDTLKLPIKKLCFEGPESELVKTENTQVVILLVSVITWKFLQEEKGFSAEYFAGHSLGEYSALVASGRLDFGVALKLVRRRGELMQMASPAGGGAMIAVLNTDANELAKICQEIGDGKSWIANYNSPQQIVVSGSVASIEKVEAHLSEIKKKSIRLAVSAPFHCPLMSDVRKEMTGPIMELDFKSKRHESFVIPNRTSNPTTVYENTFLIEQIDHSVMWTQTIQNAQKCGVERFVEVGPGKVLQGLAKRCLAQPFAGTISGSDPI